MGSDALSRERVSALSSILGHTAGVGQLVLWGKAHTRGVRSEVVSEQHKGIQKFFPYSCPGDSNVKPRLRNTEIKQEEAVSKENLI